MHTLLTSYTMNRGHVYARMKVQTRLGPTQRKVERRQCTVEHSGTMLGASGSELFPRSEGALRAVHDVGWATERNGIGMRRIKVSMTWRRSKMLAAYLTARLAHTLEIKGDVFQTH